MFVLFVAQMFPSYIFYSHELKCRLLRGQRSYPLSLPERAHCFSSTWCILGSILIFHLRPPGFMPKPLDLAKLGAELTSRIADHRDIVVQRARALTSADLPEERKAGQEAI